MSIACYYRLPTCHMLFNSGLVKKIPGLLTPSLRKCKNFPFNPIDSVSLSKQYKLTHYNVTGLLEIKFDTYTDHFLKPECSKFPPSSVSLTWRRLVKSCIARLWYWPWVHPKWRAASGIRDSSNNHTKNIQGIRNQAILAAGSTHETVRLDDAESFRATFSYSFVQYVMWRHLAGTILSHVCSQPNSRASCTYLWSISDTKTKTTEMQRNVGGE
jgi:hypothetical protein